jgi:molybdopterin/thiamine biosynthesis adenylyltransferase
VNKYHIYIIGAGGVASYLLPALIKTFRPTEVTLVDQDQLEERNLDRQLFAFDQIGMMKADALIQHHFPIHSYRGGESGFGTYTVEETFRVNVLPQWFSTSTKVPDDVDLIICVADNHMARRDAMQAAVALGINCYIGGNEYVDSQAWVLRPEFADTPKDPRVRYPAILTSMEGSPIRCTGEAQEASPQLAMANFHCAAKILHLMWVWERFFRENRAELEAAAIDQLPVELFTSLTENSAR